MAIDRDVNEALEAAGINCYTKLINTLGKGQISEPHLNTDVWPGANYGTFVVIDENKAIEIMQHVRQMRKKLGSEGIKAFMWTIDDVT